MNTELQLDHNIIDSNKHGKSAKDNRFTDLEKLLDMTETASGSSVQSMKTTCYRNLTWKKRHGMNLLITYNKSPLLTTSQKGSEDMMAPM